MKKLDVFVNDSPAVPNPTPSGGTSVELPKTWWAQGARAAAIMLVVGLAVVAGAAWIAFGDETRDKFTLFQLLTLGFLFALVCAVAYAMGRCRVTATREALVVVNGFRTHRLAWGEIAAIGLTKGAPWARLETYEGFRLSLVGIQSADGPKSQAAVVTLRELAAELRD